MENHRRKPSINIGDLSRGVKKTPIKKFQKLAIQFSPSEFLRNSTNFKNFQKMAEQKSTKININSRSRSRSKDPSETNSSKMRKIKKISSYFLNENSLKNIANSRGYTERYKNNTNIALNNKPLYPINNHNSRKSSIGRRKNQRTKSFGRKYSDPKIKKKHQSVKRKEKMKKSTFVKLPKNSRRSGLAMEEINFLNTRSYDFGESIEEYDSKVHNLERLLNDGNPKFSSGRKGNISYDYTNQEILIKNLDEGKKFFF